MADTGLEGRRVRGYFAAVNRAAGVPVMFDPAVLGMSPARRARLEAAFHRGLPDSWVRALNPAPALPRPGRPGAISAAGCEAAAPCR